MPEKSASRPRAQTRTRRGVFGKVEPGLWTGWLEWRGKTGPEARFHLSSSPRVRSAAVDRDNQREGRQNGHDSDHGRLT